ncbi:MAG: hypothetical protein WC365_08995 [Candidatus Babeliales bacterium]|jgi:hypothetical protein
MTDNYLDDSFPDKKFNKAIENCDYETLSSITYCGKPIADAEFITALKKIDELKLINDGLTISQILWQIQHPNEKTEVAFIYDNIKSKINKEELQKTMIKLFGSF